VASLSVAAIVVSHAQAENLSRVLDCLNNQSQALSQVVVVETSAELASLEIARTIGFSGISAPNSKLGAAISAGVAALKEPPGWLWILHDDSFPEAGALSRLAFAAEVSPSVAIIGPKLLDATRPIRIQQLGITVTRTGRPFVHVQNEYDQGQFDQTTDVFAVSTAGMLVSYSAWQQLGGLNDSTPPLAQDLELGAKARAAGYRVMVAPSARVQHHQLSANGQRPKKWLGGGPVQAISKAHIHMASLLLPLPLFISLYLALPFIALLVIPAMLIEKKPARIFGQFKAWIWAWGTISKRFAARSELRSLGSVKSLRSLSATRAQVRRRRRANLAQDPIRDEDAPKGFVASNSAWLLAVTLLASARLFPQGAITTESWLPLGRNLESVLASASAWVGQTGIPTDPIRYFYLLMAAIYPNDPSLAFAWFVFLGTSIALVGIWQLLANFVSQIWIRNLGALLYSLTFVLAAATNGWFIELILVVFLPWTIHFAVRAVNTSSPSRSWRWMGLAGISGAIVAIANPVVFAVLFLALMVLCLRSIRRAGILIWAALPGSVLVFPWVRWAIGVEPWLLLNPNYGTAAPLTVWFDQSALFGFFLSALLALLGLAFAANRQVWYFASLGLLAFSAAQFQPYGSSFGAIGLALISFLVLGLIGLAKLESALSRKLLGSFLLVCAVFPTLFFSAGQEGLFKFVDSRTMPALVVAAADVDPGVKTLMIHSTDPVVASLIIGDGVSQDELSFAEFWVNPEKDFNNELALLTAHLVAGNSNNVAQLLSDTGVSFILLDPSNRASNAQMSTAIGAMTELLPAGETRFGSLWKTSGKTDPSILVDPVTEERDLALWLLAAFALLAIPTPSTIRGYRRIAKGEDS
jgi:GT2 family glycosyltransferase